MSAVGFAFTNVLIRKGVKPDDPDNGVFVTTLFNVLVITTIVVVLIFYKSLPTWNVAGVLWFVAAGMATTLLARVTLFGGIRRIGPSRASSIRNTRPIVSIFIALMFLGERLSNLALLGTLVSCFGLFLLVYEAFGLKTVHKGKRTKEDPTEKTLTTQAMVEGTPVLPTRVDTSATSIVLTGTLLAIMSSIASGSGQAIRKIGLEYMPNAFLGAMIGTWTALFSYVAILAIRGEIQAVVQSNFRAFRPYFWLAGIGSTVGQVSFFVAITFAPVSQVVVITASETILTLILSVVFLRRLDSINRWVMVSALAVFTGAVLVSLS